MKLKNVFSSAIASMFVAGSVFAQDGINNLERIGKPVPEGISLQPASTAVASTTHFLDNLLLWLCFALVLFVVVLLLAVVIFFRDTGKEPKRFSHNTPLEIAWTLIPVLILVALGVVSVPALKKQTELPEGDIVINVVGLQWSWDYEYPEENISFNARVLERDELAEYGYEDNEYLLATNNAIVVPVGKDVIVNVTSDNVIHSWKVPAFAVQVDAVPGRTLTTYFNATKEGIYFGQCSELCGILHAYMPITVKVVSEEQYAAWLEKAKVEFASGPVVEPTDIELASN